MSCGDITDFLISKWRQSFRFFNRSRDGVLTRENLENLSDYMSKKSGATPEQASKCLEMWMKWILRFQPDPNIIVDENRCVQVCGDLFKKDVKHMRELNVETASDIFDVIDLDGDGTISLQDFTIFYEAAGFTNPELAQRNFLGMDKNGDGLVQRDEFIDDYVRFFTDPDSVTGAAFICACQVETDIQQ